MWAAFRADGTMWSNMWSNSYAPEPAEGNWVTAVTSSTSFAALSTNGTIFCWGTLSTSDFGWKSTCPAGNDYVAIRATYRSACALRNDGSVECWGDQVAVGKTYGSSWSHPFPNDAGYVALYATQQAWLGMKADGTLKAWGRLDYPFGADLPAGALPAGSVKRIYAGRSNFVALKTDGTLYCWGNPTTGGIMTKLYYIPPGYIYEYGPLKGTASPGEYRTIDICPNANHTWSQIYSTATGWVGIDTNGSIGTWGLFGGSSGAQYNILSFKHYPDDTGYVRCRTGKHAFACQKADGSVSFWGGPWSGASYRSEKYVLTPEDEAETGWDFCGSSENSHNELPDDDEGSACGTAQGFPWAAFPAEPSPPPHSPPHSPLPSPELPAGSASDPAVPVPAAPSFTLIMQIKPTDSVFGYTSPYWTNGEVLNPSFTEEVSGTDVLLPAYSSVPLTGIRLCVGVVSNCYTYMFNTTTTDAPYASAKALFGSGLHIRAADLEQEAFEDVFSYNAGTASSNHNQRPSHTDCMMLPGINADCGNGGEAEGHNRARFGFCGNALYETCEDGGDADFAIGIGCTAQGPQAPHPSYGAGFNAYYLKPSASTDGPGEQTFQAWLYAVHPPSPPQPLASAFPRSPYTPTLAAVVAVGVSAAVASSTATALVAGSAPTVGIVMPLLALLQRASLNGAVSAKRPQWAQDLLTDLQWVAGIGARPPQLDPPLDGCPLSTLVTNLVGGLRKTVEAYLITIGTVLALHLLYLLRMYMRATRAKEIQIAAKGPAKGPAKRRCDCGTDRFSVVNVWPVPEVLATLFFSSGLLSGSVTTLSAALADGGCCVPYACWLPWVVLLYLLMFYAWVANELRRFVTRAAPHMPLVDVESAQTSKAKKRWQKAARMVVGRQRARKKWQPLVKELDQGARRRALAAHQPRPLPLRLD